MLERVRALLGASRTAEDVRDDGPKSKYRRAPVLLRIRSSTWFIGLAVGFGGAHFSLFVHGRCFPPHPADNRRSFRSSRGSFVLFACRTGHSLPPPGPWIWRHRRQDGLACLGVRRRLDRLESRRRCRRCEVQESTDPALPRSPLHGRRSGTLHGGRVVWYVPGRSYTRPEKLVLTVTPPSQL